VCSLVNRSRHREDPRPPFRHGVAEVDRSSPNSTLLAMATVVYSGQEKDGRESTKAADPTSILARVWDANGLIASPPDQSLASHPLC
jgi:hypothetical protein